MGIAPVLRILFSLLMVLPLILDITGNPIQAILLLGYVGVGALIYVFHGMRHSKLANGIDLSAVEVPLAGVDPVAEPSFINPFERSLR